MSRFTKLFLFCFCMSLLPVLAESGPQKPDLPTGVSEDWWSQVQRSIQLEEYGVTGFRAVNPAHRFEAQFDARGLQLAPTGGSSWEWGLSLTGWGRPAALETVTDGWLSSDEDRVELNRGSLTEWFVNRPAGMEHGFTVPSPPRDDGDRLVFDMTFAGGLRPVFAEDGQAVDFYGSGNVSVLRYAKLIVTDAAGAVLPARMEPIAGGIRIVVEDSNAIYPITVDPLATSPSWAATGESAGDQFGYSVTTAGDVNGDGYSDVVVGAYGHTSDTGKAYLYLGGTSGLVPSPSWNPTGEAVGDYFGYSVATAGDVNGDGYSDVVVGAYGHSGSTGKAFLYLGSAAGLVASPAWNTTGEAAGDEFGFSVATAGDVNGDGYSDVIVGAHRNNSSTGTAYVYFGGAGGLSTFAYWTAAGEAAFDEFGQSVATAGDVNGDGYSDVVIGAYGNNSYTGKAYLFLGSLSGLETSASWNTVGEVAGDRLGWSVATAGDVNGDGFADLVVGAIGHTVFTGKAYLYMGEVSGLAPNPSWTISGEFTDDRFGRSVATAGDVNGDGYSDVVVGGHDKAAMYTGGTSGLSVAASWSATSESTNDRFGYSVATAGDVNGDGYSDVVVGAYGRTSFTGKAYLYMGGADDLALNASWTATAEGVADDFGISVTTAGDVNGDGYSDVIVGAERSDENGIDSGKAYLYLGGPNGLSANALWTATGEAEYDKFGGSVATAGDVNGDGYSDVVVGANGSTSNTGKAYLYIGGASGLSVNASWTASGENLSDYFGESVATAGDVNGDGFSDVVIGARQSTINPGKAYLYLGGARGLSVSPSWTASGEATGDAFGWSVATAGDVNGDGYSDVIVGAFLFSNEMGRAYLYLGGAGGLAASASWTATGVEVTDWFGRSVSTAGDVNGDGYSDVIVGAPISFGVSDQAFLYLGGPGGLATNASWSLRGELLDSFFGTSVAAAGDVNADGYSDVIVGANGHTDNTGKAFLYLGSASGLPATSSWAVEGEGTFTYFGTSVAAAGDVNGDGYPDVVIGAHGGDFNPGKAYLYLGGGGAGGTLMPRQLRPDLSASIGLGGTAYEQQYRISLSLRSPVGRVARRLEWQYAPWGGFPSIVHSPVHSDTQWFSSQVSRTALVTLAEDLQRYVWRARVKYHPAQSPFLPASPWVTLSGNGLYEADCRSSSELAPPPCLAPDEELYITTITIDGNGKPVLHYQDPNQPADVTGYNVYRSDSPVGPWVLLGSNVVDMDAGAPNNQYVDQSGDVGGPWFYEVAAWNNTCGAEGPY